MATSCACVYMGPVATRSNSHLLPLFLTVFKIYTSFLYVFCLFLRSLARRRLLCLLPSVRTFIAIVLFKFALLLLILFLMWLFIWLFGCVVILSICYLFLLFVLGSLDLFLRFYILSFVLFLSFFCLLRCFIL